MAVTKNDVAKKDWSATVLLHIISIQRYTDESCKIAHNGQVVYEINDLNKT